MYTSLDNPLIGSPQKELVNEICITHKPEYTNQLWGTDTGYSDQKISIGKQVQIFLRFLMILLFKM